MWCETRGVKALIHLRGKKGEGKFAIINAEEVQSVWKHNTKWCLTNKGYVIAHSKIEKKSVLLHHVIMGKPESPLEINHKDHNPLNNVKTNLEIITKSENLRHRRVLRGVTSQFKGVSWNVARGKWETRINIDGKYKFLGYFVNELDAARAYRTACHDHGIFLTEPNWAQLDSKPTQAVQNANTITNYFAPKN